MRRQCRCSRVTWALTCTTILDLRRSTSGRKNRTGNPVTDTLDSAPAESKCDGALWRDQNPMRDAVGANKLAKSALYARHAVEAPFRGALSRAELRHTSQPRFEFQLPPLSSCVSCDTYACRLHTRHALLGHGVRGSAKCEEISARALLLNRRQQAQEGATSKLCKTTAHAGNE